MTSPLAVTIADLVTGDDYDIDLLLSDVPSGQTVVSGWLTVKRYDTDTDANAVLQKNIGTTLTSAGQITVSGVYTRVVFTLSSVDTRLLNPAGEYVYDIQVRTNADKNKTIEKGTIRPVQDVTRLQ